jgi:hypothetical protein
MMTQIDKGEYYTITNNNIVWMLPNRFPFCFRVDNSTSSKGTIEVINLVEESFEEQIHKILEVFPHVPLDIANQAVRECKGVLEMALNRIMKIVDGESETKKRKLEKLQDPVESSSLNDEELPNCDFLFRLNYIPKIKPEGNIGAVRLEQLITVFELRLTLLLIKMQRILMIFFTFIFTPY